MAWSPALGSCCLTEGYMSTIFFWGVELGLNGGARWCEEGRFRVGGVALACWEPGRNSSWLGHNLRNEPTSHPNAVVNNNRNLVELRKFGSRTVGG